MDEVARTLDAYESDAESFVATYRRWSTAEYRGEEFFDSLPGKRVLDVGCGPGSDAATFQDRELDVTGIDLTRAFLEAARNRVPGASFVRGDMRRLPFRDRSFDGCWCCASLLHVPRSDAPGTLEEFRRVLDRGGVLYLSVKHADGGDPHDDGCEAQYGGNERQDDGGEWQADGRYLVRYRPDEIRALLVESGFDTVRIGVEPSDRSEATWVRALALRA